ncbi:MAG TPA: hypothetical protein VGK67_13740 [Myxococcales bacterium]|jgi:hypothetical protein
MRAALPLFSAALALALASCATTAKPPPEPEKAPLAREPGKPLEVAILAARYTLPPRIDVDDHRDAPGNYLFSFVDRVTSCEGFFLFETVSQPAVHDQYVQEKTAALHADWRSQNLAVTQRLESLKLLGQDAHVTVFDVQGTDGAARAGLVDRHFADQNLSVVNYTFCADPGLLPSQLEAVAEVVNSQKR